MRPGLAGVGGFEHADAIGVSGCGCRARRCRRRRRWHSTGPPRWRRWSRWGCLRRRWGTRCGRRFRSSRRRRRRSPYKRCRAGWRGRRRRRCGRRAWGRRRASAIRPAGWPGYWPCGVPLLGEDRKSHQPEQAQRGEKDKPTVSNEHIGCSSMRLGFGASRMKHFITGEGSEQRIRGIHSVSDALTATQRQEWEDRARYPGTIPPTLLFTLPNRAPCPVTPCGGTGSNPQLPRRQNGPATLFIFAERDGRFAGVLMVVAEIDGVPAAHVGAALAAQAFRMDRQQVLLGVA